MGPRGGAIKWFWSDWPLWKRKSSITGAVKHPDKRAFCAQTAQQMPQSPFTVLTMGPCRRRSVLRVPAVVSEIVFRTILTQTCPLLLLLSPPATFPSSWSCGHGGLIAWWNFYHCNNNNLCFDGLIHSAGHHLTEKRLCSHVTMVSVRLNPFLSVD